MRLDAGPDFVSNQVAASSEYGARVNGAVFWNLERFGEDHFASAGKICLSDGSVVVFRFGRLTVSGILPSHVNRMLLPV